MFQFNNSRSLWVIAIQNQGLINTLLQVGGMYIDFIGVGALGDFLFDILGRQPALDPLH